MESSTIGRRIAAEILAAAANRAGASFHNLFHKPSHHWTRGNRSGEVSYSFNIYGKSPELLLSDYFSIFSHLKWRAGRVKSGPEGRIARAETLELRALRFPQSGKAAESATQTDRQSAPAKRSASRIPAAGTTGKKQP